MTDYLHPDLTGKVEDLGERIDRTSTDLHEVRKDVTGLRTSIKTLTTNAENQAKELKKNFSSINKQFKDVTGSVKRLRQDIDHLHSQVQIGSGMPQAGFDDWDFTEEMISAVRAGLRDTTPVQLKLQQLSTEESEWSAQVVRWDAVLREAVAAVRTARPGRTRDWRRAERLWTALRDMGPRPADKAAQAQAEFAAANLEYQSLSAVSAHGRQMDEIMRAGIRGRVEHAVGKRLVLPVWLVGALGPFPPMEADRLGRWIDAAIALIRYRLLAEHHNPVTPFGAPPNDPHLDKVYTAVKAQCAKEYAARNW